jgi:hypothetical protein
MAAVASQVPACFLSGFTQDNNFQPLNDCGVPNPFFYHQFYDDFDLTGKTLANSYTLVTAGTGALIPAAQAGPGGQVLFTTGTTAGFSGMQLGFAGFNVNIAPKKLFFIMRVQAPTATLTDANTSIQGGLAQTTATPNVITDGLFLTLSNGVLRLISIVASTPTTITIPSAAVSAALVNNTYFDMGYYLTRTGDVLVFFDSQLVGYVPQSNLTTTGNPQNAGAVGRMLAPTFTTANLNPTLTLVQAGTVARTMIADFFGVFQER